MRLCVLAALLVGCGRIEFAALPDAQATADTATADSCLAVPCPAFATFCESFANVTPPMFPGWSDYQRMKFSTGQLDPGSQAIATATPSCGGPSINTRVVGANQWVQLFAPVVSNPSYTRAMMYIPSTNSTLNVDTLGLGDVGSQFLLIDVHPDASAALNTSAGITVAGSTAPGVFDRDRWHCIEVATTYADTSAGHITVTVDGATVIDTAGVTQPNMAMPLNQFIVGISTSNLETGTVDMYFDDIAVAARPIGC